MNLTPTQERTIVKRLGTRALVVLTVLLSTSMVVMAKPAAANSSTSLATGNSWIITEFSAQASTAGYTATTPAAVNSGQALGGVGLKGVGTAVVSGVGAVIGIASFPGVKGLFGGSDGSTAALPSVGSAPPAGVVGHPNCAPLSFTAGAGVTLTSCGTHTDPAYWSISFQYVTQGSQHQLYYRSRAAGTGTLGSCQFAQWSGTTGQTVTLANIYAKSPGNGRVWYGNNSCTTAPIATISWDGAPSGSLDTNPDRWITTTIQCKFPDGTVVTRTGNGATFKRAAGVTSTAQEVTGPDALECPAGSVMLTGKAEVVTAGTDTRVQLGSTYNVDPDLRDGYLNNYSDCLTTLCVLHVVRLVPELDCASKSPGEGHPCRDWATSTDLDTNWACRYGDYTMAMSACASLENVYGLNPTLQPNTGSGAAPAPVQPDIAEDTTANQTPGLSGSGCVPSGLGLLNPFWVFKAVGCAIKWAFVPSATSMQTAVTNTKNAWLTSPPGAYLSGFGTMIGSFGTLGSGAGGCAGPALSIEPLQLNDWHPISACTAPMSTVAGIVKLLLTVMVYVGAAVVAARLLAASLGLHLPAFNRGDD